MKSLERNFLETQAIPIEMGGLLQALGEFKGRQDLFRHQPPQIPASARETPLYMKELCVRFNRLWDERRISPLLIIPAFVLDFLCIHPFTDGNGRISRLLTVLLLHQAEYEVGRYISLARLIEGSKETYYEALQMSSEGWPEGHHRLKPW